MSRTKIQNCGGCKCAFRFTGVCNYLFLTGEKRSCNPGKECVHRAKSLPKRILQSIEQEKTALAIPSAATMRRRIRNKATA